MISRIHTYVLCCKNRQQAADTKRAHQKRHATTSRDASPIFRTAQFAGENVARDRTCTRVTRRNLHSKEGVDQGLPIATDLLAVRLETEWKRPGATSRKHRLVESAEIRMI